LLLQNPYPGAPPHTQPQAPPDQRPQILFTGFPKVQRAHLEVLSDAGGLRVVKTVTQGLVFLCIGPTAGPTKVAKARAQGVYIVHEPELHGLLETGELPDYAVDDLV
jgi:BRCT domain type II-containing protein